MRIDYVTYPLIKDILAKKPLNQVPMRVPSDYKVTSTFESAYNTVVKILDHLDSPQ